MTLGLSEDIQCHVWQYSYSVFANHQIRPQVKWTVSLAIADGHFNLPQGFVWECMESAVHSCISVVSEMG